MDASPLQRIDSFPYRHRLADIMSSPVVTAAADRPMAWAAGEMDRRHISSLLVLGQGPGRLSEASGPPFGILTERDVLRALARAGGVALEGPIGDYMSRSERRRGGEGGVRTG